MLRRAQVHETVEECGGGTRVAACNSQRWFPTPVADKAACLLELAALCSAEKGQGERQCLACANGIAAHWNKLRVAGCTDSLVGGACAGRV